MSVRPEPPARGSGSDDAGNRDTRLATPSPELGRACPPAYVRCRVLPRAQRVQSPVRFVRGVSLVCCRNRGGAWGQEIRCRDGQRVEHSCTPCRGSALCDRGRPGSPTAETTRARSAAPSPSQVERHQKLSAGLSELGIPLRNDQLMIPANSPKRQVDCGVQRLPRA